MRIVEVRYFIYVLNLLFILYELHFKAQVNCSYNVTPTFDLQSNKQTIVG